MFLSFFFCFKFCIHLYLSCDALHYRLLYNSFIAFGISARAVFCSSSFYGVWLLLVEFGSSLYGSHVPFVEFGSLLWCLAPLTSWATAVEQSANSSSNQPEAMPLSLMKRPWRACEAITKQQRLSGQARATIYTAHTRTTPPEGRLGIGRAPFDYVRFAWLGWYTCRKKRRIIQKARLWGPGLGLALRFSVS